MVVGHVFRAVGSLFGQAGDAGPSKGSSSLEACEFRITWDIDSLHPHVSRCYEFTIQLRCFGWRVCRAAILRQLRAHAAAAGVDPTPYETDLPRDDWDATPQLFVAGCVPEDYMRNLRNAGVEVVTVPNSNVDRKGNQSAAVKIKEYMQSLGRLDRKVYVLHICGDAHYQSDIQQLKIKGAKVCLMCKLADPTTSKTYLQQVNIDGSPIDFEGFSHTFEGLFRTPNLAPNSEQMLQQPLEGILFPPAVSKATAPPPGTNNGGNSGSSGQQDWQHKTQRAQPDRPRQLMLLPAKGWAANGMYPALNASKEHGIVHAASLHQGADAALELRRSALVQHFKRVMQNRPARNRLNKIAVPEPGDDWVIPPRDIGHDTDHVVAHEIAKLGKSTTQCVIELQAEAIMHAIRILTLSACGTPVVKHHVGRQMAQSKQELLDAALVCLGAVIEEDIESSKLMSVSWSYPKTTVQRATSGFPKAWPTHSDAGSQKPWETVHVIITCSGSASRADHQTQNQQRLHAFARKVQEFVFGGGQSGPQLCASVELKTADSFTWSPSAANEPSAVVTVAEFDDRVAVLLLATKEAYLQTLVDSLKRATNLQEAQKEPTTIKLHVPDIKLLWMLRHLPSSLPATAHGDALAAVKDALDKGVARVTPASRLVELYPSDGDSKATELLAQFQDALDAIKTHTMWKAMPLHPLHQQAYSQSPDLQEALAQQFDPVQGGDSVLSTEVRNLATDSDKPIVLSAQEWLERQQSDKQQTAPTYRLAKQRAVDGPAAFKLCQQPAPTPSDARTLQKPTSVDSVDVEAVLQQARALNVATSTVLDNAINPVTTVYDPSLRNAYLALTKPQRQALRAAIEGKSLKNSAVGEDSAPANSSPQSKNLSAGKSQHESLSGAEALSSSPGDGYTIPASRTAVSVQQCTSSDASVRDVTADEVLNSMPKTLEHRAQLKTQLAVKGIILQVVVGDVMETPAHVLLNLRNGRRPGDAEQALIQEYPDFKSERDAWEEQLGRSVQPSDAFVYDVPRHGLLRSDVVYDVVVAQKCLGHHAPVSEDDYRDAYKHLLTRESTKTSEIVVVTTPAYGVTAIGDAVGGSYDGIHGLLGAIEDEGHEAGSCAVVLRLVITPQQEAVLLPEVLRLVAQLGAKYSMKDRIDTSSELRATQQVIWRVGMDARPAAKLDLKLLDLASTRPGFGNFFERSPDDYRFWLPFEPSLAAEIEEQYQQRNAQFDFDPQSARGGSAPGGVAPYCIHFHQHSDWTGHKAADLATFGADHMQVKVNTGFRRPVQRIVVEKMVSKSTNCRSWNMEDVCIQQRLAPPAPPTTLTRDPPISSQAIEPSVGKTAEHAGADKQGDASTAAAGLHVLPLWGFPASLDRSIKYLQAWFKAKVEGDWEAVSVPDVALAEVRKIAQAEAQRPDGLLASTYKFELSSAQEMLFMTQQMHAPMHEQRREALMAEVCGAISTATCSAGITAPALPPFWDASLPGNGTHIVSIAMGSSEWNSVLAAVESHSVQYPPPQVVEIARVQNAYLWAQYVRKREYVLKEKYKTGHQSGSVQCGADETVPDANRLTVQKSLWHATCDLDPVEIITTADGHESVFYASDARAADAAQKTDLYGCFGKAVYFASSPEYPMLHQYAYEEDCADKLFYCDVIVGACKDLGSPPEALPAQLCLPQLEEDSPWWRALGNRSVCHLHDSVAAEVDGHELVAVPLRAPLAYPRYIVTFK